MFKKCKRLYIFKLFKHKNKCIILSVKTLHSILVKIKDNISYLGTWSRNK